MLAILLAALQIVRGRSVPIVNTDGSRPKFNMSSATYPGLGLWMDPSGNVLISNGQKSIVAFGPGLERGEYKDVLYLDGRALCLNEQSMTLYGCPNGTPLHPKWKNNGYRIKHTSGFFGSDKCLTLNGNAVMFEPCGSRPEQEWQFTPAQYYQQPPSPQPSVYPAVPVPKGNGGMRDSSSDVRPLYPSLNDPHAVCIPPPNPGPSAPQIGWNAPSAPPMCPPQRPLNGWKPPAAVSPPAPPRQQLVVTLPTNTQQPLNQICQSVNSAPANSLCASPPPPTAFATPTPPSSSCSQTVVALFPADVNAAVSNDCLPDAAQFTSAPANETLCSLSSSQAAGVSCN
ncbi:hypothetical protein PAPHI01_1140 [Pancytospora philotis]|nr:hypothetical protein PAPHI01_1140 [Pancytospora philotis]